MRIRQNDPDVPDFLEADRVFTPSRLFIYYGAREIINRGLRAYRADNDAGAAAMRPSMPWRGSTLRRCRMARWANWSES